MYILYIYIYRERERERETERETACTAIFSLMNRSRDKCNEKAFIDSFRLCRYYL